MNLCIETSDFKESDGVMVPFKFEQVVSVTILRQALRGIITGKITECRHKEPIDPKMF